MNQSAKLNIQEIFIKWSNRLKTHGNMNKSYFYVTVTKAFGFIKSDCNFRRKNYDFYNFLVLKI